MRVMLLSPDPKAIANVIESTSDTWMATTARPDTLDLDCDFYVSHNYQYIMRGHVLERIKNRFINIHISYLPWNRGSYPNFWSWYEGTPKGVTIHQIDDGVDTGPIFSQMIVTFEPGGTLRSTWQRLQSSALLLLQKSWPAIRFGDLEAVAQRGPATSHSDAEMSAMWPSFPLKYDTPVTEVERAGERVRSALAHLALRRE